MTYFSIIPILQMRKQTLQELKLLVQAHEDSESWRVGVKFESSKESASKAQVPNHLFYANV